MAENDVPHIITELGLTLTPEQAQEGRRPDRTPIGPFRSREAAQSHADSLIAAYGGTGEASFAPLTPAPRWYRPQPFVSQVIRDLIPTFAYKPGWEFHLTPFVEEGEQRGWTLVIVSESPDSYDHSKMIRVGHPFLIPPASYNRETWMAWVFDRIGEVEGKHEAGEFFMVDGVRVFGPHHGNGEDPYRVWFVGDYAKTRTKAGEDNAS